MGGDPARREPRAHERRPAERLDRAVPRSRPRGRAPAARRRAGDLLPRPARPRARRQRPRRSRHARCSLPRRRGHDARAQASTVLAASRASEAFAFDRAARLFASALELAPDEAQRGDLAVSLGEALANAGRGREAAEAYLTAASLRRPDDALDLRRRAAGAALCARGTSIAPRRPTETCSRPSPCRCRSRRVALSWRCSRAEPKHVCVVCRSTSARRATYPRGTRSVSTRAGWSAPASAWSTPSSARTSRRGVWCSPWTWGSLAASRARWPARPRSRRRPVAGSRDADGPARADGERVSRRRLGTPYEAACGRRAPWASRRRWRGGGSMDTSRATRAESVFRDRVHRGSVGDGHDAGSRSGPSRTSATDRAEARTRMPATAPRGRRAR